MATDHQGCGNNDCLRPGCGSTRTIAESEQLALAAIRETAARWADDFDRLAVADLMRELKR